ncbi:MAG: hypothetical protein IJU08_03220 [Bacteroidales bacterium]|nr:hypothetical protein [Bacteroidales bacterium]
MKRTYIISLMAAILALVSCTDTSLDPLTGVFPDAQEPVLSNLTESSMEKTERNRIFTLKFSGSGATVETQLVGARNQYYLEPNVYGPGESNGCFLIGPTRINGNTVQSGTITVQKKAGDVYKFIFVLFDSAGNAYRTKWEGELVYEPDPEPVVLTKVLVAQSNTNGTVTFKLGTADMDVDMMGSPVGDGFALTADLYSADGYLQEGVYTPAANSDNVGPGQYAPGYEYDLSEWGMGIMHWGTCWWAGTAVTHINKEPITVEKKGSKFVITWGSEETYPHWATFTGEIEALTPSAAPNPDYSYTDELSDAVDETFAPVAGVKTHNLTLRNAAGEEIAWFQLVLAEGVTDYSGDYFCKEYAHEDHTFGNGYDLSMWGMGMGGTRYIAADGSTVLVQPGESLSIAKLGDDIWEVSGDGFDFVFGNGSGEVTADYIISDELGDPVDESFNPVAGVKTHNLTLKNADGVESAWFQLVLTEGSTDFSGEYVCKEYAHEDHTFGNGYDLSMWGMGMGGSRYIAADGSTVMVNPGETLTITQVGADTWKFTGSTGYVFVGRFE